MGGSFHHMDIFLSVMKTKWFVVTLSLDELLKMYTIFTKGPENQGFQKFLLEFPEKKYTNLYRISLTGVRRGLKHLPKGSSVGLIVLPCLEYLMVSEEI